MNLFIYSNIEVSNGGCGSMWEVIVEKKYCHIQHACGDGRSVNQYLKLRIVVSEK